MSDNIRACPPPAELPPACGSQDIRGRDSFLDSMDRVECVAAAINTRHQLTAWMQGPLRDLIPHQKTLLGFGHVGYSALQIDLVHAADLASDCFTSLHSNAGYFISPIMAKWLEQRLSQITLPSNIGRIANDPLLRNCKNMGSIMAFSMRASRSERAVCLSSNSSMSSSRWMRVPICSRSVSHDGSPISGRVSNRKFST